MGTIHEKFMRHALRLAVRGGLAVRPNPQVGCVIVRDGRIVGQGWHRRWGSVHAEIEALQDARDEARGATAYVTLEPCNHYGKTPPCTRALINAGVREVVIAMRDPNPGVAGGGVERLESAGIRCVTGVCETEAKAINTTFVTNVTRRRPEVWLKIAQSIDGIIMPARGGNRWITSETSRREVHRMRAMHDAVLVGAGTVRVDDPSLDVRYGYQGAPRRVVLTTRFDFSPDSRVFSDDAAAATLVLSTRAGMRTHAATVASLRARGVTVEACRSGRNGAPGIPHVLRHLFDARVYSVFVEGGASVFSSFLAAGSVDRLDMFVAPLVLGEGLGAFQTLSGRSLATAPKFRMEKMRKSGQDLHITYFPEE